MKFESILVVSLLIVYIVPEANSSCPSLPELASVQQVATQCLDSDNNCSLLTDALQQLNTTPILNLTSGVHRVSRYVPISDLQDVFIIGAGMDEVTVVCDGGLGLSFVNVTGLTMCGFTVAGCGLTGPPVSTFVEKLQEEVFVWFRVPSEVHYAVLLGNCWDVFLYGIHVTNTSGLGLLGINVMGNSTFNNVNFTFNIRPGCIKSPPRYPFKLSREIYDQIGGGAYFLYQDYHSDDMGFVENEEASPHHLTITDSVFSYNAECTYSAITQVNYQGYFALSNDLHMIGAGGGLSIFMAQNEFNVHAIITQSVFTKNDARYGAGAHVSTFAGLDFGKVVFHKCLFNENGFRVTNEDGTFTESMSSGGAGLVIFTDVVSPVNAVQPVTVSNNISVVVIITETDFTSNVAMVKGGGMLVSALYNSPHRVLGPNLLGFFTIAIYLEKCTFWNNLAHYGAAAHIMQNADRGTSGTLQFHLEDVEFSSNKINVDMKRLFNQQTQSLKIASALALHNVYCSISGRVVCSDNEATGLLVYSGVVLMYNGSQLLVERNSGRLGGGIHFEGTESTVAMDRNSFLSLQNNTASIFGGAVYVSPSIISHDPLRPVDTSSGCFITPFPIMNCFVDTCFSLTAINISVHLRGNSAPGGSVVYGSTLETCAWTILLQKLRRGRSVYQILYEDFNEVIQIDLEPNSSAVVSTPPAQIFISGMQNYSSILEVFPGQSVEVSIMVYDQFGHIVPATVTSVILDQTTNANSTLGSGGYAFTDSSSHTARLRITGLEELEFQVYVIEINTLISAGLTVSILPCFEGFNFESENRSCMCNQPLLSRDIECDLDNFTLVSPDGVWIGTLTANASTDNLVISDCHLNFCNVGKKAFRPPDYDSQCRTGSNRMGVLCGGCAEGYSAVLGRKECRKCSNITLLLIPLFGVLGIAVFVMIAFLEVTIEKGWMYMILFYCNLVTLSPMHVTLSSSWDFILVPAYLLSFELGISSCLYDGMTAIELAVLKFLFPLYLIILMVTFSLLNRKITFGRHFSPVKTFMTLSVMFYTSILDTCIEIINLTTLETLGGEKHYRWYSDPNVVYFSSIFHCFLFFLALGILATYVMPIPFLLLSPQVAYRCFKKLAPFFDALWAPFKPKYRFWLGVRLLALLVLFFSSSSFPLVTRNITSGIVLLVLLEIQLSIRPFKLEWVNILDGVLIGNLIALMFGVFFFAVENRSTRSVLYFVFTIGFGYCVIIGILFYHFALRYNLRKRLHRLRLRTMLFKMKVTQSEVSVETSTPAADETALGVSDAAKHSPAVVPSATVPPTRSTLSVLPHSFVYPNRASFSHLRESLLDDFAIND